MMWLVMIYSIVLRDFGPAATMAFNSCSFTGCTITPPPSLPSWQPEQPGKGWKRKSPSDFRRVPWLQRLSFWSFLAFFYRNELSCKRGVMLGCTWMVVTGSWFWPIGSGFESLALQERHRAVGAVGQTPEGDQWGDRQWGAWRQWEAWQELRASTKGWRPWQWQQEAGHWDCWWRARENYQESLVDVGRILVLECEEGWQWKHRFRCCWFRWEPKECWAWGPTESSKVAEHACLAARARPDNFWKSPELWWDSPVSMEDHQLPGERKRPWRWWPAAARTSSRRSSTRTRTTSRANDGFVLMSSKISCSRSRCSWGGAKAQRRWMEPSTSWCMTMEAATGVQFHGCNSVCKFIFPFKLFIILC